MTVIKPVAGALLLALAFPVHSEVAGSPNVKTDQSRTIKDDSQTSTDRSQGVDIKKGHGTESRAGTEKRHEQSRNKEAGIEQSATLWIMQALQAHGSQQVADCASEVAVFIGVNSGDLDPFDEANYQRPTLCVVAVSELATQIAPRLTKRPGLLPSPGSPAGAKLAAITPAMEIASFQKAEKAANNRANVNYSGSGHGMQWAAGKWFVKADGGAITLWSAGRPWFDQDHVAGNKLTLRVSNMDNNSLASTSGTSSSDTLQKDITVSRKKSSSTSSGGERSNTAGSGVSAGK